MNTFNVLLASNQEIWATCKFLDNSDSLGIWVHETPEYVFHEPYRNIDKGRYLLLIVRNKSINK